MVSRTNIYAKETKFETELAASTVAKVLPDYFFFNITIDHPKPKYSGLKKTKNVANVAK